MQRQQNLVSTAACGENSEARIQCGKVSAVSYAAAQDSWAQMWAHLEVHEHR